MEDLIMQYVILYAPALVTVATVLMGVIKCVRVIKELKKNLDDNDKMKVILQENYEIKKELKRLISKLDRVKTDDDGSNKKV